MIAPVHQHLFCARLDVAIDGLENTVEEGEVVGIPMGPRILMAMPSPIGAPF